MEVRTLVLEPKGARPVSRDPAPRHFPGRPSSGSPRKAPFKTSELGSPLGFQDRSGGGPTACWWGGGRVSPLNKFSRRTLRHLMLETLGIPLCSNP